MLWRFISFAFISNSISQYNITTHIIINHLNCTPEAYHPHTSATPKQLGLTHICVKREGRDGGTFRPLPLFSVYYESYFDILSIQVLITFKI